MHSFHLIGTFFLATISFVSALPSLLQIGRTQSVAVKGKLLCNGEPMANVKLKLFDADTLDLDDLMDEGKSDSNGTFYLSGHENELTTIDPKLNIYHNCNDERKVKHFPCIYYSQYYMEAIVTNDFVFTITDKVSIKIPKNFVTDGEQAKDTFDVGILNLSGHLPGETRDCIN
ncbi:unnamed protein product [Anisakis simplex]|uniref:Transthyretin-like family-containing protein n=1 Tax=Anisakis simplex TaxID=6269 RepID=A0A0M3KBX2_ANISI|nr:unnamed protein product [Anisakis simplex]